MIRGSSLQPPESRRQHSSTPYVVPFPSLYHYGASGGTANSSRLSASKEEAIRLWRSSFFDCPPAFQQQQHDPLRRRRTLSSSLLSPSLMRGVEEEEEEERGEGGEARDLHQWIHTGGAAEPDPRGDPNTTCITLSPAGDLPLYHEKHAARRHTPQSTASAPSPPGGAPLMPIFDATSSAVRRQQVGVKMFQFRRLAVFHHLLGLSWKALVLGSIASYVLVVSLYAVLYYVWGMFCGISNAEFAGRPKVLSYYFAIVSLAANGGYLGEPDPMTDSSHVCFTGRAVLVAMCSYTNIVFVGLVAALIVGKAASREKISRRIVFSDFCVLNEVRPQQIHRCGSRTPERRRRRRGRRPRGGAGRANDSSQTTSRRKDGRSLQQQQHRRRGVVEKEQAAPWRQRRTAVPGSAAEEVAEYPLPLVEQEGGEEGVGAARSPPSPPPRDAATPPPPVDSEGRVEAGRCAVFRGSRSSAAASSASRSSSSRTSCSSAEEEEEEEEEEVYPEWRLDFRLTDMEPRRPAAGGRLTLYCVSVEEQAAYWESKRTLRQDTIRRWQRRHERRRLAAEAKERRHRERHRRLYREAKAQRMAKRALRQRSGSSPQEHKTSATSSSSCATLLDSSSSSASDSSKDGSHDVSSCSSSCRSSTRHRSSSSSFSFSSSLRTQHSHRRRGGRRATASRYTTSSSQLSLSSSSCPLRNTSSCSSIHFLPSATYHEGGDRSGRHSMASSSCYSGSASRVDDEEEEEEVSAVRSSSHSGRHGKQMLLYRRRRGRSGKPPHGSTAPTVAPSVSPIEEAGVPHSHGSDHPSGDQPALTVAAAQEELELEATVGSSGGGQRRRLTPLQAVAEASSLNSSTCRSSHGAAAAAWRKSLVQRTHTSTSDGLHPPPPLPLKPLYNSAQQAKPKTPQHRQRHASGGGSTSRGSRRPQRPLRGAQQRHASSRSALSHRTNSFLPGAASSSSPARVRTCVQELRWTCDEEPDPTAAMRHSPLLFPHHHYQQQQQQQAVQGGGAPLQLWFPVVISHHVNRSSPLFRFLYERYLRQRAAAESQQLETPSPMSHARQRQRRLRQKRGERQHRRDVHGPQQQDSRNAHPIMEEKKEQEAEAEEVEPTTGHRHRHRHHHHHHHRHRHASRHDSRGRHRSGHHRHHAASSHHTSPLARSGLLAGSSLHSSCVPTSYAPFQVVAVYEAVEQGTGAPILARKVFSPFEMMQSFRFSSKLVQLGTFSAGTDGNPFQEVVLDYHYFNTMVPLKRRGEEAAAGAGHGVSRYSTPLSAYHQHHSSEEPRDGRRRQRCTGRRGAEAAHHSHHRRRGEEEAAGDGELQTSAKGGGHRSHRDRS